MKTIFISLVAIFFISYSNAQILDSIQVIETANITKAIDTVNLNKASIQEININGLYGAINNVQIAIPRITSIYYNQSLMDSLLRPFYTIGLDSVTQDSTFTPRYRVALNELTQDTTYVTIPKEKDAISKVYTFKLDSLQINNYIEPEIVKPTELAQVPVWWENRNSIGFDIHQIAFLNWNAGGSNSVAGLVKIYFSRTYEKLYTLWKSEISAKYGLISQQDRELRKTDDEIKLNSTFGYRSNSTSNWYYSAKFNFRTQFTDGFKYPNTETPISRFFAPAYLHLGLGMQYNLKPKHLSLFFSPMTLKSTFVNDEQLSNDGAFGVEKGKRARHEFGTSFQGSWDVEVFKNVAMSNRLGLYTDYLNNFGNIDVNWDIKFKFKVNKFIEANFSSQLIYDDDIKHKEDINGDGQLETLGARVQLKQQLGIGVLYRF